MVFIASKTPDDASTTERLAAFTLSVIGSILIAAAMFKWIEKASMRMEEKRPLYCQLIKTLYWLSLHNGNE
jgi:hypothetical protein